KQVAERLGWTTAESDGRRGWKQLREFLLERALEHDVPSVLFRLAVQRLASEKVRVVRPGVVSLMREIASARTEAERHLYRLCEPILTDELITQLDGLLVVPEEMSVSRMVWLHRGSTSASPTGIKSTGGPGTGGRAGVRARPHGWGDRGAGCGESPGPARPRSAEDARLGQRPTPPNCVHPRVL
ncbi:MAG: hypothetical protein QOD82_43, partial [Pseudonocardiales bacterium]|nr:hypothetical protein [Pseudonocardiales bacterium]